jgi:hypothetical protein
MQELKDIFSTIDQLIQSCDLDYVELEAINIDDSLFNEYYNQRLVNSFLFSFIKIQDKIGTKLFKKILYELKEIDNLSVPMKDILNILEKLEIINNTDDWDRLREIRNNLAHEYPSDIQERVDNVQFSLQGYELIKDIYNNLKKYCEINSIIT